MSSERTVSASRIPAEQRVFSLVLALVASPYGLTKSELLGTVYGYAERYSAGSGGASIERQFERDKDQVRRLGIPIETFDAPDAPGDNRLTRYRISKERLQLPAGVTFAAEELAVLRLASLAWRDGSLGDQSRWASMKLTSLTANLDVRHLGIAPKLSMPEPAAPALQRAVEEGLSARFAYQLPERDEPLVRRVAPLRLHRAEGRWHLIAWDLDRDADRVFLLSRIASEVRVGPERFEERLREHIEPALERLLDHGRQQRARISVRPGSAAEARLEPRAAVLDPRPEDEHRVLEIGTLDEHALALELAGFGDELAVLGPQQLQGSVLGLLRRVRAQHSQSTGTDTSTAVASGVEDHA